jgi:hypothetical protein
MWPRRFGRGYPGSGFVADCPRVDECRGGDEIGEAFFAKSGLQQDDLVDCINGAMALLVKIGDGLLGRAQNYGVAGDGSRRIAS